MDRGKIVNSPQLARLWRWDLRLSGWARHPSASVLLFILSANIARACVDISLLRTVLLDDNADLKVYASTDWW